MPTATQARVFARYFWGFPVSVFLERLCRFPQNVSRRAGMIAVAIAAPKLERPYICVGRLQALMARTRAWSRTASSRCGRMRKISLARERRGSSSGS